MKNLGGNLGVAVFGIVAFALTVLVVIVIERMTTFNLFTFSFWVVIPVGALATGIAAASGYYFGSLFFHTRPTWFLLIQIVIVAALAQLAIYYGEYSTLVLDDGTKVADFIPFFEYLDIYLRSTHLRIGRGRVDTGEVGDFGYWLAVIQFLGFLVGGVFVYLMLRAYPTCEQCARYLRTLIKKDQTFSTQEEFAQYYDTLFQHPVDTQGFADLMRWEPRQSEAVQGTIMAKSTLRGCPHCKTQLMSQEVKVMGDKDWRDVPRLTRHIRIPRGIDLRSVFRPA